MILFFTKFIAFTNPRGEIFVCFALASWPNVFIHRNDNNFYVAKGGGDMEGKKTLAKRQGEETTNKRDKCPRDKIPQISHTSTKSRGIFSHAPGGPFSPFHLLPMGTNHGRI
jgi:hypothetical protein